MTQQWEYYRDENLDEYELNELGTEGWELVSVASMGLHSSDLEFFFKRPCVKPKNDKKEEG